jgi:hypothetical protein
MLPFGNDMQDYAKAAIEKGFFDKAFKVVAKVDGFDLERAFDLTNHTDHNWTENYGLAVCVDSVVRSTSVGDVMRIKDKFYIVDSVGFIEV